MLEPGDLYLDHNATAPLLAEVRETMQRALDVALVNPASAHRAGERSRRRLEAAREQVAALLHATPAEIVFTSGATEANHLALFGSIAPGLAGSHVLVSAIEHSSVLDAAALLGELGAEVERVAPGPDGVVAAQSVLAALRPATRLVALMAANNETGVLQPVAELAPELASRGVAFHVDAVQACGRVGFDVAAIPATTCSITAHKLGGPPGVGALFVRRGHALAPFLRGGRQERGLRGGTHNLLGILGFGTAAESALARRERAAAAAAVRDEFERSLLALCPGATVVGASASRLPNTSSVTFRGGDAGRILAELSRRGLHASAGSACQAGATEPSHVLRAMGLPAAASRATVRFSFGPEHGRDEARRAAELVAAVARAAGAGPT